VRRTRFNRRKWSWNNKKFGNGHQRDPKLRLTALASASSKLLLCSTLASYWRLYVPGMNVTSESLASGGLLRRRPYTTGRPNYQSLRKDSMPCGWRKRVNVATMWSERQTTWRRSLWDRVTVITRFSIACRLAATVSKSKLLYDWRLTANQFVSASSPSRPTTRDFFFDRTLAIAVCM
jgi:hypothetical protein